MTDTKGRFSTTRRGFLASAVAGGAAAAAGRAGAAGDPAITELPPWTQALGDGVDARPYGYPSEFESDVVRRDVPWLTADPVSSVNFTPIHELDGIITPNGLCFERHHAGIAEVDPAATPADDQRPRGHAARLHRGRHQAVPAREPHLLPRMRRQQRDGVARGAAQRLPVHPRHDPQRHVYRRAAAHRARACRGEARRARGSWPRAPTHRR